MYKKYSFLKWLIPCLVVVAMTGSSCKKFIDQEPITSTNGDQFWKSRQSAEQGTLAMYHLLRSSFRLDQSYFILGDLTAGVFQVDYNTQWNLMPIGTHNPWGGNFDFSYVPYLEGSLQNWSRFYQVIAQCNLLLENIPKMDDDLFANVKEKKAYIGEALFMKAYTYFYMTRVWGDPVYVTRTYNDVDYGKIPPIARTPEKQVLDSCIANLKEASGLLDYVDGDPDRSLRANKGTVYALLAHIYAWRHDYTNAHLACVEVINNGGYALEPMDTYKNIWKGKSSAENIWEMAMTYQQSDAGESELDFFGIFLKGTIVDNRKSRSWLINAGGEIDALFDTTKDLRSKEVLKLVDGNDLAAKGYLLTKYTNFNYINPEKKAGAYLGNNLVLFRLSDIILLDAEALASAGDLAGAKARLALTEDRAGIDNYKSPTSQYDLLDEVVLERGRELIGEGHWFYDLIRTNEKQGWLEWVGYQPEKLTGLKGYYWPLDMSRLFPQDNLLTQNPYWAIHK